ncbi:MAG: hypothetical protein IJH12_09855 [Clostridia bacterium]|nr:hypothetical protein [Clostridia bacterium]
MNQILSFKNTENGKKILEKNTKHLCIFLILFALVLVGEGAWKLHANLNKKVNVIKPEIIGYIQSGKTLFNVKSEIGVERIIYAWNNGEETTIDKTGEKEFSFEVNNPIGVNELSLKSVGVDGSTVVYNNIKVVYDEEEDDGLGEPEEVDAPTEIVDKEEAIENDKNEPTISLTAEPGKVVITASDDIMMSYVVYSWNGGEEVKITGLSEDEKTLRAKIDALKGDNKLKIKAFDKAGNVKEFEKEVHGTDGPEIIVKKDEGKIKVTVNDEFGISKIEYNFNNEETTIDNIEGTTYEKDFEMQEGENFIIVYAYEGNVKTEYKGKTTK